VNHFGRQSTCIDFSTSDTQGDHRDIRATGSNDKKQKQGGTTMKKFGFATIVASGFAAAVLGLAGPAQADIGHHDWVQDIQQQATVGSVTPTFGNGR
jgi:hypothetical protein